VADARRHSAAAGRDGKPAGSFAFRRAARCDIRQFRAQCQAGELDGNRWPAGLGEDVWQWPSMRMDTSTQIEMPEIGDFDSNDAFSVGTWLMPRLESVHTSPRYGAIVARLDSQHASRGWELFYDEGKPEKKFGLHTEAKLIFTLVHALPNNAISVATRHPVLLRGRWNHVLATYDGSGKASGVKLYIDSKPVETEVLKDSLSGTVRTSVPLHLGRQSPDFNPLRQSRYQDFRLYARALSSEEARRVAVEDYVAELARHPLERWSEQEFKPPRSSTLPSTMARCKLWLHSSHSSMRSSPHCRKAEGSPW